MLPILLKNNIDHDTVAQNPAVTIYEVFKVIFRKPGENEALQAVVAVIHLSQWL